MLIIFIFYDTGLKKKSITIKPLISSIGSWFYYAPYVDSFILQKQNDLALLTKLVGSTFAIINFVCFTNTLYFESVLEHLK